MRGWTNWVSGIFTKTPTQSEVSKIYLSSNNFYQHKKTFFNYDEIYLSNFNFKINNREPTFETLLSMLDNRFIFLNAEFTFTQVKILLEHGFDLSRSTYRMYPAITLMEYESLYEIAKQRNLLDSLHSVSVDFNSRDLSNYPSSFVSGCYPASLVGAKLTQAQFDSLIRKKISRPLNLTGVLLSELDISECIGIHGKIISFSSYQPTSGFNTICLEKTSLQNAIIDTRILAHLASMCAFHEWFCTPELTIVVKHKEKTGYAYFIVNITELLSGIENMRNTSNDTPRMWEQTNLADELKNYVLKQVAFSDSTDLNQLNQGEKFLWLMHCVINNPQSKLCKYFWRTQPDISPNPPKTEAGFHV